MSAKIPPARLAVEIAPDWVLTTGAVHSGRVARRPRIGGQADNAASRQSDDATAQSSRAAAGGLMDIAHLSVVHVRSDAGSVWVMLARLSEVE